MSHIKIKTKSTLNQHFLVKRTASIYRGDLVVGFTGTKLDCPLVDGLLLPG